MICGSLAWALVIVAVPTAAQEAGQQRIAVLELDNPARLKDQEVTYLSELIRGSARENLLTAKFLVMTHENIVELLGNRSLGECLGDCAVETGRNLGAAYVVAGQVFEFGSELRVSVTLYDVASGNLLGSKQAGGPTVLSLEAPVKEKGRELFWKLGGGRKDREPEPELFPPRARTYEKPSEKSASTAFILSFVLPGLGQYYNGDTVRGILMDLLFAGGSIWLSDQSDREPERTSSLTIMGFGYLWSLIDAPRGAHRHNQRLAEEYRVGHLMDLDGGMMEIGLELGVDPQGKLAVGVGAYF